MIDDSYATDLLHVLQLNALELHAGNS